MRRSQPTSWLHLPLCRGLKNRRSETRNTYDQPCRRCAQDRTRCALSKRRRPQRCFCRGLRGIYLPPPKRLDAEAGGIVHYEIDLTGLDLAELKGKTVTVTLVSDAGQAESRFKITDPCLCHSPATCGLVGAHAAISYSDTTAQLSLVWRGMLMTITVGDHLPETSFTVMGPGWSRPEVDCGHLCRQEGRAFCGAGSLHLTCHKNLYAGFRRAG